MMHNQEQEEITIFHQFAQNCPIDRKSIEKRNDPEPDIFCTMQDGSAACFELSEIVAKATSINKGSNFLRI